MSLLRDLERVEERVAQLGRTAALNALQPGLQAPAVVERLATVGLVAPPEVVQYFGWHDGQGDYDATLGELWLFPGFYPMSTEEALIDYAALVVDPRWQTGWLPIFADGGGDFFVVDLESDGVIRRFRNDETIQPIEYLSLSSMIATIADAYDEGVYHLGEHGELTLDQAAFAVLAARHNPGVAWWTSE
jgi:cell wall assembly regulator SMI1